MNRFDELPLNIRNKITCVLPGAPASGVGEEPALDPNDSDVCWCWTGSFQRPRVRHRPYTSEGETEVFRHTTGCNVRERGTPMIKSPELGYAIAAHRHLFAIWNERPVRGVPRLQRCHSDYCVRPSHTVELAEVPEKARGRTKGGMPLGNALEEPQEPPGDLWAALTHPEGPSAQLTQDQVAIEVGRPISNAMWKRFQAWAAAQSDE